MADATLTGKNNRKAPNWAVHEAADGVRLAPGPYIGIVKNNMDPLRAGRLQVWIAELGGDNNDPNSWRVVNYCTPFYGVTSPDIRKEEGQDFQTNPHAYGMWMVPPDVDNKVLCTFVNGDPYKGYWFACVPEIPNLHMVPGLASGSWHGGGPEPLVEHNFKGDPKGPLPVDFYAKADTKHDVQTQIWTRQGLLQDPDRGPGISSSQRESPSRVFGFSTPGPELAAPQSTDKTSADSAKFNNANLQVKGRQGGHTFVMDDGDVDGKSQLIRLRTGNGNMLLMNDSAGFIYLINSSGSAWFEMDASGNIKAYSQAKIEMHATAGFCLETPGKFTICGSSIDIAATGALKLSGSSVDINGKSGVKVGGSGDLHLSGKKTYLTGKSCVGISGKQHIDLKAGCITFNTKKVTEASAPGSASPCQGPSHEPYGGHHSSHTNSPVTSASYNATNGVMSSNQSGNYGAAASFGVTPNTPGYYGLYTNAEGPIKFNPGLQGSIAGQAANLGDAAKYNAFDTLATSYQNANLQLPTASTGFAININDPNSANIPGISPGEKQNNPGSLSGLNDPFAIGQVGGLNVYSSPEDGIAALALALDEIQAQGATTVADFVQGYMQRKGTVLNGTSLPA
jgi:hypothetical protein